MARVTSEVGHGAPVETPVDMVAVAAGVRAIVMARIAGKLGTAPRGRKIFGRPPCAIVALRIAVAKGVGALAVGIQHGWGAAVGTDTC